MPEWARGKTADEILQMTETLYNSMLQGTNQQQPSQPQNNPQQTQPQPVQQPSQEQMPAPPDPDLMYSNKEEYNRQLSQWHQATMQQTIQQASQPLLNPLASMARNNARTDPEFKDVWDRYGPEIDAVMQQVPVQNRTNEQLWKQAAQMVAGQHYKELARDAAERQAAQPTQATISSTDAPPQTQTTTGTDPIDALFSADHPAIQEYKKDGIKPSQVRQHAKRKGMTTEQYAEMLKKRQLIRSKQFTSSN